MNRYLTAAVFLVVAIIGLGMTIVVHRAEERAIETRFEVSADEVIDRVRERISQHTAFVAATHAFFAANRGNVSHPMFTTYVEGLNIKDSVSGIQGIGFARVIRTGAETGTEVEISRNYGENIKVWPEITDEDVRTPIVLLEPRNDRNMAAIGYDMYSEAVRRQAMQEAIEENAPRASGPLDLVQEITENKQAGFLIYVPLRIETAANPDGNVIGFVYAPFRAGDLHEAALDRMQDTPASVRTVDISDGYKKLLYQSPNFAESEKSTPFEVTRSMEVGGRTWQMTIRAKPDFKSTVSTRLGTVALAAISILLALALALTTRSQLLALDTSKKLHATSEKSLKERELMLQEMKHRIKNSIARILAIARQTAAHSDDIDEFSESFTSRLQAMAHAQDMLTRSHWQRTDLKELLEKEMEQVFGTSTTNYTVNGTSVELNERATQALGLVFHELATNALKYGRVSEEESQLDIKWQFEGSKKSERLVIDWTEYTSQPHDEPVKPGFGTRLIDANIRGELSGEIDRDITPTGMKIQIRVPVSAYS